MNNGAGNVLYKEGKYNKDEEFYLHFGNGTGYNAYFDNKYLAENSKAFAWNAVAYNGNMTTEQQADFIQPNDYCVRGE